jgi:hypothetical protein
LYFVRHTTVTKLSVCALRTSQSISAVDAETTTESDDAEHQHCVSSRCRLKSIKRAITGFCDRLESIGGRIPGPEVG